MVPKSIMSQLPTASLEIAYFSRRSVLFEILSALRIILFARHFARPPNLERRAFREAYGAD